MLHSHLVAFHSTLYLYLDYFIKYTVYISARPYSLTGVRPDVLQQTILLSQSVQRVVSFTSGSDITGQSVGGVGTLNSSTVFVNVSNVDLNRSMVLSLDDSVGGRTLSWDVQFHLKKC